MATPFTVEEDNGVVREFCSRADAARAYGVTVGKIKDRLRWGWTNRQAVDLDPRPERPRPSNTKTFELLVRGEQMVFHGYAALETYFGVPADRIRAAVKRGWALEAAVGLTDPPPRAPGHNAKKFVIQDGEEQLVFYGYAALGEHYRIHPDTLRHRIDAGQSPEAAVQLTPPENQRAVSVKIGEGWKHFRSLAAACKHFGKVYETVYDRFHNGDLTLEQALDLEPHPRRLKRSFGIVYLITHNPSGLQYVGQTVTTLERRWQGHCSAATSSPTPQDSLVSDLIRQDGPLVFRTEVLATANNQHDLDLLEIQHIRELNTLSPAGLNKSSGGGGCSAVSGREISVAGKTFPSKAAAAKHHGINPATFCRRLKAGKTPEQAAGLEDLGCPTTVAKPVRFRHGGVVYSYPSRTSAAKACGLSVTCVTHRLDVLGWAPRRALMTPADSNRGNRQKISFQYDGRRYSYKSRSEAARAWGLKYGTLKRRLRQGWTPRRALTAPVRGGDALRECGHVSEA